MENFQEFVCNTKYVMNNIKKIKRLLKEEKGLMNKNICILSGSTIGEIKNYLELYLLLQGIKPVFYIGEYNRYFEEAVFENQKLADFRPDIIYIHTTNKNIGCLPNQCDNEQSRTEKLEKEYQRYEQIWDSLKNKYNCPIIQNNFECFQYRAMGNADAYFFNGQNRFVSDLNNKFYEYARSNKGMYINDINYQAAYFGLEKWFDMSKWYLYKYAMSPEAMPLLCNNIANIIKSIYGKNKKSLIMDLDNTLWGGVIGDDGIDNIRLGDETPDGRAFVDFQKYIKQLETQGVVINIVSKNEYENALQGLSHSASVLKKDDFTSIKANWDNKHDNIKRISEEINLLLDSFVFVDDNPAERELVKSQLPHVEVPTIKEPEEYVKILDQLGYFEVTSLSHDDLKRKDFYEQNQKRHLEEEKYCDYESYLKSLEMTSHIGFFRDEHIDRITQLINKTNQFNFTTIRYSQEEIADMMHNERYITLEADLTDKFGANGLISMLLAEIDKYTVTIDLWVMSCRVFKRHMEYAMFDALVYECRKRNISKIIGLYRPTKKNALIKDYYGALGFVKGKGSEVEDTWEYAIPTDYKNKNKVIGVK